MLKDYAIVQLLKERRNLTAHQISVVLDEDEVVIKNKLTMLAKDGAVFSSSGILDTTYEANLLHPDLRMSNKNVSQVSFTTNLIDRSNYVNAIRFKKILWMSAMEIDELDAAHRTAWNRLVRGGMVTKDLIELLDCLPEPEDEF